MFRFIGRALSLAFLYCLSVIALPVLLALAALPELEAMFRRWRPAAFPVAAACLSIVLFPVLAFAADPVVAQVLPQTVVSTAVDFGPILTQLVIIAGGVVAVIGAFALKSLDAYLTAKAAEQGIKITAAQTAQWDDALQKMMGAGIEKVTGLTADMVAKGNLTVDMKSAFLANAAQHGISYFPEVLKAMKLMTSQGQADTVAIQSALQSRMGMLQASQVVKPQTLATATSGSTAAAG